jgi:hypothetical protein
MTDIPDLPAALSIPDVDARAQALSQNAARLLYHRLTAFPHQPKPGAKIPDYALPQVQMMAEAMMAVYQQGFRDGGEWIAKALDAASEMAKGPGA